MSIKVMTLVWDRFPGSGSELLAMLALADWCSDTGDNLYPSISTLAAKIRVSVSQARRILHNLIEQGYVHVVGNEFGGAPGATRDYEIDVRALKALPVIEAEISPATARMHARGGVDARPSTDARDGWHGCASTAGMDASQTVIRTVSKPLEEREEGAPPKKSPPTAKNLKPCFNWETGRFENLDPVTIAGWAEAYPAIDVMQEIRKAEAWQKANPKNRKSAIERFLNNWLSRAQDKAPRVQQTFRGNGGAPNRQEALEQNNRAAAARFAANLRESEFDYETH